MLEGLPSDRLAAFWNSAPLFHFSALSSARPNLEGRVNFDM